MWKHKEKKQEMSQGNHEENQNRNDKIISYVSLGIVGLSIAILIGGSVGYAIGKYRYEEMGKKGIMKLTQEAEVLQADNDGMVETIENKDIQIVACEEQIAELVEKNESLEDAVRLQEEKKLEKASAWNLRIVNRIHTVQEDEKVQLAEVENFQVDKRIVEPLQKMLAAGRKEGIDMMICSAYRSWEKQTTLFNNKMKKQMKTGKTYAEALAATAEWVAIPGTSEHQLGLALDIVSTDYQKLDEGQADTPVAKWLAKHAHEYGFILRYPKGKKDETAIQYEPWHYRYVGIEAAEEIKAQDITLEAYLSAE